MLTACGDDGGHHVPAADCSQDERAQMYMVGLDRTGDAGVTIVLLESDPAPPAKGDNDWHIQILDGSGTPLDDLNIEVFPFMPDHGHGTTVPVGVTSMDPGTGEYMISPLNLWMPGLWTLTFNVDDGETAVITDEIEFGVCIEG